MVFTRAFGPENGLFSPKAMAFKVKRGVYHRNEAPFSG